MNESDEKKCLVFVAHAGDEIIGLGGTLLRLKETGWKIKIVYATVPRGDDAEIDLFKKTCEQVEVVLRAEISCWLMCENRLSVSDTTKYLVQEEYGGFMPNFVFVVNPIDINSDCRALANIVLEKALLFDDSEIMFYELYREGKSRTLNFIPSHYVDVTAQIDQLEKLQSLYLVDGKSSVSTASNQLVRVNRAREYGFGLNSVSEAFMRISKTGPLMNGLNKIFVPSPYDLPEVTAIDV